MSWTEQTRASLAGTACVREAVRSGYMFVCLERDKNRAASGSGGLWSRHTLAHTHIRACIRVGLFRRAACVSRDVGQPSLPSLCSAWTPLPKSHAQLSRLAVSFHAPLLCPLHRTHKPPSLGIPLHDPFHSANSTGATSVFQPPELPMVVPVQTPPSSETFGSSGNRARDIQGEF